MVDEGLSSLGDSPKQAIYFYLEKTFKINTQEIPYKIEEFAEALKIFGRGANFVQILIIKCLYNRVGQIFEYKQEDLVFSEYIAAARQSFLKKKIQAYARYEVRIRPNQKGGIYARGSS